MDEVSDALTDATAGLPEPEGLLLLVVVDGEIAPWDERSTNRPGSAVR